MKISRLFLIDGLGAMASTTFLGLLAFVFYPHFGLPQVVLIWLMSLAAGLCLFSLGAAFLNPPRPLLFLQFIIGANSIYALLTTGLLLLFFSQLTVWDGLYFVSELIVLALVIRFELQFLRTTKTRGL